MRAFTELFAILIIGLTLGGALSWMSIQSNHGFGTLKVGQWTAWPLSGSSDADPYTKAKVAADGDVPLGAAEGLAFHATLDQRGDPLRLDCQYSLQGQTPPARFWTLSAHNIDGHVLATREGAASNIISRALLRNAKGEFIIQAGPKLAAGNWLETTGTGPFQLILRLYDSPVTTSGGGGEAVMPTISLIGCPA